VFDDDAADPAAPPTPNPPSDPAPAPTRRRRIAILAAVVVVLGLVLTAIVAYRWGSGGTPTSLPSARPTPTPTKDPTTAQIYNTIAPSIVSIEAIHPTVTESGTGVIINADATILTALHVVRGAATIHVTFADGTAATATVSTSDPTTDIATLTPNGLPSVVVPAVLGSSNRLAIGDNVIAIGNQLGLTRTTTAGVVSGLDRVAPGPEGGNLTGLIQFDAAVNPGSSGGPLVNIKGQTVGIVVALANPTTAGTFIGIGFAVPIGAAVSGGGGRAPQQ
jgi:S1-C subfamily serine protease